MKYNIVASIDVRAKTKAEAMERFDNMVLKTEQKYPNIKVGFCSIEVKE